MTVDCRLLRRGDMTLNPGGYTITEVYWVTGFQVGATTTAVLAAAQAGTTTGDILPGYGASYGDPAVPLREFRVVKRAAQKAEITAVYSDAAIFFGAASDQRAGGSFGRRVPIQMPVFRQMQPDQNGDIVYRFDPETEYLPVQTLWYDGVPQAQITPTTAQMQSDLLDNHGTIKLFFGTYMMLTDYEIVVRQGSSTRVRLRFEAPAIMPERPPDFYGDNSAPIPELPAFGRYLYDKHLPPNTGPSINIRTADEYMREWTQMSFKVVMSDGTFIE